MTFDEAIEVLANSENNKLVKEGQLEYGLYRAYDVVGVLQKLRKEYAPTVEMTQEQKEYLNSIIREVGEVFEPNEIPVDVKLTDKVVELESGYILFKYLNAILHPETIKIVDE